MAKKLTRDEVTVREIGGYIVTLTSIGLTIRQKGERKTFGPLTVDGLYVRAGMQEANRLIREGKQNKTIKVSRGLLATERTSTLS